MFFLKNPLFTWIQELYFTRISQGCIQFAFFGLKDSGNRVPGTLSSLAFIPFSDLNVGAPGPLKMVGLLLAGRERFGAGGI